MIDAIARGDKTVTRRLVRDGETECRYKPGRIYQATNRPRFLASGMRRNTKGGWKSIPIKILSVRKEKLWDITEDEAKLEGLTGMFRPNMTAREQFFWIWGAIHGIEVAINAPVWRIEFQRVPESWK